MNNLLTSYSIEFNPPLNNVVSFIIAVSILLLTVYSVRNLLPDLPNRVRLFLASLRIIAVLFFLFIFFQPSIVQTTYYLEKDTIALLIDASRSMNYKSDSVSRLDTAREIAKGILARDDIRNEHNIVTYLFSKNIYLNSSPEEIRVINEDTTDILTSLENVRIKHPDLSSIILVSDGADNNLLLNVREDSSSLIKRFAKNLSVPVHTFLAATDKKTNDISLRILSYSPVGFIGKEFEISVRLSNNSELTESVPLTIKENGVPVFSGKYKIPHNTSKDILLTLYPRNTGRNVYEVLTPPQSGEEFTENNSDFFSSKIKKENLRILQITGSVSYDVRFLRHLFKKAPDIDLISFFILRTLESDVNAPDSELSLIPFPTDTVIRESLFGFDVVIFQDFGFVPYGLNSTFSDLNSFIRKGGALIFFTGNNWYRLIGDFITFFDDCMPAVPRTDYNAIENVIYRPELTLEGKTHPVTRILDSQDENNLLFKNLPELHGVHRLSSIKPGAVTLMTAKSQENLPVLLINRCEKGKTVLITTDELWRFSFSEKTPDEFNLYNKLMNNLLLWVTGEPDKEDIVISAGRNRKPSEELRGRYSGIRAESEIYMQTEDGRVTKGRIEADGEFYFDISNLPEGLHSARISYNNQVYNISFFKKRSDIEMQEIAPRPDILKALSKYSGGRYFGDIKDIKNLKPEKKELKRIHTKSSSPLTNRGIFFALLMALFFAEWFFRRMYGHQ